MGKRRRRKDHVAPLVKRYTLNPSFILIFFPFHGFFLPKISVPSFPLCLISVSLSLSLPVLSFCLVGFLPRLPHRWRTFLLLASLHRVYLVILFEPHLALRSFIRRGFLSPPRPLFALPLTTGVHLPRRTRSSSGGLLVAPFEP